MTLFHPLCLMGLLTLPMVLLLDTVLAALPTTQPGEEEILLWPQGAPDAKGNETADRPMIVPYPAKNPNGCAVVIVPGGGYGHLAFDHEGRDVARWLNQHGISAFILRYRVAPYKHPVPLLDAQRAVRLVRSRASQWKIDTKRVGMLGFSAGGHLTSTVGTHFDSGDGNAVDPIDRESSRPDFLVLGYPVITLKPPHAHMGSRTNLLGEAPDPKLLDSLCNETQVTPQTPPTFLVHSTTDGGVPVENSRMFYDALQRAGVKSKLVIFEVGGHGYGLAKDDPTLGTWSAKCIEWMREIKMIPPA